MQRPPAIEALTSIRFVFAMMVVVAHFLGIHQDAWRPGDVDDIGQIAVLCFFVPSGFVIAYNFPKFEGTSDRGRFILLRLARLYPVHLITLVAFVSVSRLGLTTIREHPEAFLLNLTLLQSWVPAAYISMGFNLPSWSISDEWFFYLMYPMLVCGSKVVRGLAISAPLVASAALMQWGCPTSSDLLDCTMLHYTFPPTRFVEFLAGVALCWTVRRGIFAAASPTTAAFVFAISAALILDINGASATLASFAYLSSEVARKILAIAAAAALVWSLTKESPISKVLRHKLLVFGGEISFSIYMIHLGTLVAISKVPALSDRPLSVQFAIFVTSTLIASSAMFLLIEKPCRDMAKRRLRSRSDDAKNVR